MSTNANISSYWDNFEVIVIQNFPVYYTHCNTSHVRRTCREKWNSVFKVAGNDKGMVFVTVHVDESQEVRNHFHHAFFENSVLYTNVFGVQKWFKETHDSDFRYFVGDVFTSAHGGQISSPNLDSTSDEEPASGEEIVSDVESVSDATEDACTHDDTGYIPDFPEL